MLRVVATGVYYHPVATTRSILAKLEFENHKNQYFSWLLRSEQVKANIFENRMIKLTI